MIWQEKPQESPIDELIPRGAKALLGSACLEQEVELQWKAAVGSPQNTLAFSYAQNKCGA